MLRPTCIWNEAFMSYMEMGGGFKILVTPNYQEGAVQLSIREDLTYPKFIATRSVKHGNDFHAESHTGEIGGYMSTILGKRSCR
jgi:hypothetical protein